MRSLLRRDDTHYLPPTRRGTIDYGPWTVDCVFLFTAKDTESSQRSLSPPLGDRGFTPQQLPPSSG
jgi:hypothetical protein